MSLSLSASGLWVCVKQWVYYIHCHYCFSLSAAFFLLFYLFVSVSISFALAHSLFRSLGARIMCICIPSPLLIIYTVSEWVSQFVYVRFACVYCCNYISDQGQRTPLLHSMESLPFAHLRLNALHTLPAKRARWIIIFMCVYDIR